MIVVCGVPRSGTSMCMQTLAILGMPMAAPKFVKEHDNYRHLNPKGLYELDIKDGVKTNEYDGKVIKLFGWQFLQTPWHLIDKVIHTTRDLDDSIDSYQKLKPYLPADDLTSHEIVVQNDFCIRKKLNGSELAVDYNSAISDPKTYINSLILYLGINPTDEQIAEAKNNIVWH